jgi:hypothetical protein
VASDDLDGDGVANEDDAFPSDPAASQDTDADGMPDQWNEGYTAFDSTTGLVLDEDDDNDGYTDREELEAGTDSKNAADAPVTGGLNMAIIKAILNESNARGSQPRTEN